MTQDFDDNESRVGLAHPYVSEPRRRPEYEVRRKRLPPGLYRVHVSKCEVEVTDYGARAVHWHLEVYGPLGVSGSLHPVHCTDTADVFWQLQRDLAVLGINLEHYHDMDGACAKAVNKLAYVEALPVCNRDESDRVHFQQLATTHHLAPPRHWRETRAELEARFGILDFPTEYHRLEKRNFPDDPHNDDDAYAFDDEKLG